MSTNSVQMKAVKQFKGLIDRKRPTNLSETLGAGMRILGLSSHEVVTGQALHKSKSVDLDDREAVESALAAEGIHPGSGHLDPDAPMLDIFKTSPATAPIETSKQDSQKPTSPKSKSVPPAIQTDHSHEKGHAHNPLDENPLFLGIGIGHDDPASPSEIVAESPAAAEFSIYDTAYAEEVERIRLAQGHETTVYLTRRVDSNAEYKADENMVGLPAKHEVEGTPHAGWKNLVDRAKAKGDEVARSESVAGAGEVAGRMLGNLQALGGGLLGGRGKDKEAKKM